MGKRSRPSPALIVAALALFVGLAGTGLAASRYIITSTSQIKPSVLRQLGTRGSERLVNAIENAVPVISVTGPTGENVPLVKSTWVQHPGEPEEIAGEVGVTLPAWNATGPTGCSVGSEPGRAFAGSLALRITVDGQVRSILRLPATTPTMTVRRQVFWPRLANGSAVDVLAASNEDITRSVTVSLEDSCGTGGGAASEHFVLQTLNLDVIALR